MVESRGIASRQQLRETSKQKPSLTELVADAELSSVQRRAWGIITSMDLSNPDLPADAGALLLMCFLRQKSGSLSVIKKITGITNNSDAHSLADRVGESDELIRQYNIFSSRYKKEV